MKLIINTYSSKNGNKVFPKAELMCDFDIDNSDTVNACGYEIKAFNTNNGGVTTWKVTIKAEEDIKKPVGFELAFAFDGAKNTDYVFAPSAVYNGNRFTKLKKEYAPMFTADDNISANMDTAITDIPSLSTNGEGELYINSGDTATPCMGYFDNENKKGLLIFSPQKNTLGNYGYKISERGVNTSDGERTFSLCSPCVRLKKYGMCTTEAVSYDRPVKLNKGNSVVISFALHTFAAEDINAFYEYFYLNRRSFINNSKYPLAVPFRKAYEIIEKKYNEANWQNKDMFYRSSEAEGSICGQWQTGWVGGTMNTLPMFMIGNENSVARSRQTLDFVFEKIQAPSGLLYGIFCDGKAYGDGFYSQKNINFVMSRKNADALYYLLKQMLYLSKKGEKIPEKWIVGVRKFVDATADICNKYGHFGQFLDIQKQEILIGATASAGIVMAGLALASQYFNRIQYLDCAEKLATFYNENYIEKGLTNGGPGEILQCPDSESAFGLLESYVTLYDITGKDCYKIIAENIARQCSSWCVSYDYEYKESTQFYQRNVSTTGSVWANTQNKHSAPGICTLSGSSLLRLYRMTGDDSYLTLLKDISHNITQYLSVDENPIRQSYVWHNGKAEKQKLAKIKRTNKLLLAKPKTKFGKKMYKLLAVSLLNKTGRINERVNLSDWEGDNNVGEIPAGSCWCEVSVMLTSVEIPSLYIDAKRNKYFVFDHISATRIKDDKKEKIGEIYTITNNTIYDTVVTIYLDLGEKIVDMSLADFTEIPLKVGETKRFRVQNNAVKIDK